MDVEEFRIRGKEMVDYICQYATRIQEKRVTAEVEPGYLKELIPATAPINGEKWDDIMADVESKIMPGVTHWNHPRFHAYFSAGNSYPSILGDMLSDAIGSIGFSWASIPACTELESIVTDWLGQAIGLPDNFLAGKSNGTGGGVIEGSASECILVSLLAARSEAIKYLKEQKPGLEDSDYLPKLIAYCSKEAHSCVEKAAMIALVKLRILDSDEESSLRGDTLEKAMKQDEADGYLPFFVSATLGTTGSAAMDTLSEIGPVCKKFPKAWLHVDAAYAGNAFICPELRYLMKGIEYADSFNTNTNKWLLVNFDCSCLWVQKRNRLTHALNVDPLYLQHEKSDEAIDYRHWGIPLSRRFRSLKLWFVIRKYGLSGLQDYIRNHIRLAKCFEQKVKKDSRFEVVNNVLLSLVCFRLRAPDKTNVELLAKINHSGKIHMIPSMVKGKFVIRFCVVYEHAVEADIDYAWKVITQYADEVLENTNSLNLDTIQPLPRRPLNKTLSRRLSFTRSVSMDKYKASLGRTNLCDGAKPILIPDEHMVPFELEDKLSSVQIDPLTSNDSAEKCYRKSSQNSMPCPCIECKLSILNRNRAFKIRSISNRG